jgi:ABC-type Na+ efflux pump permease subunit
VSGLESPLVARVARGLVDVAVVDEDEGRDRLRRGEAPALLEFPPGARAAIARGEPVTARVTVASTDAALRARSLDGARAIAERLALQRGRDPRTKLPSGGAGEPRVSVRRDPGTSPSLVLAFLPGILLMSLLFVAAGMAEDLWAERDRGTLRRALASPAGAGSLLTGKVLAGTAIMATVAAVGMTTAHALLGVPLSAAVGGGVLATLAGASLLCVFLALHAVSTSLRAGRLLSTLVLFPLLMAGGSFFPPSMMPDALAAGGRLTPNGMAGARIAELLTGEVRPHVLSLTALVLLGVGAVAAHLARRRLEARVREGAP